MVVDAIALLDPFSRLVDDSLVVCGNLFLDLGREALFEHFLEFLSNGVFFHLRVLCLLSADSGLKPEVPYTK